MLTKCLKRNSLSMEGPYWQGSVFIHWHCSGGMALALCMLVKGFVSEPSTSTPTPPSRSLLLLFVFSVLGFELRAFCLVSRQTWAPPPALFTLVILDTGSHFLPRPAWTLIVLLYTSCHCWDDRHLPLHPAVVCRNEVSRTFCLGWPRNECNPLYLSLPSC
jgi:hypothetical protein